MLTSTSPRRIPATSAGPRGNTSAITTPSPSFAPPSMPSALFSHAESEAEQWSTRSAARKTDLRKVSDFRMRRDMAMRKSKKHLVWMDCEMTGLDPMKDGLLEIATIITNYDL